MAESTTLQVLDERFSCLKVVLFIVNLLQI